MQLSASCGVDGAGPRQLTETCAGRPAERGEVRPRPQRRSRAPAAVRSAAEASASEALAVLTNGGSEGARTSERSEDRQAEPSGSMGAGIGLGEQARWPPAARRTTTIDATVTASAPTSAVACTAGSRTGTNATTATGTWTIATSPSSSGRRVRAQKYAVHSGAVTIAERQHVEKRVQIGIGDLVVGERGCRRRDPQGRRGSAENCRETSHGRTSGVSRPLPCVMTVRCGRAGKHVSECVPNGWSGVLLRRSPAPGRGRPPARPASPPGRRGSPARGSRRWSCRPAR